jgi:hypothetical protein
MSKLSHLKHINFNKYSIDSISYENYNLKNPNVKKKEYELSDNKDAVDNDRLAYIQIIYNNNPIIYVTTPKMFCPFGLNKKSYTMNLQFNNYSTDPEMKGFFEFIKNIEFQQMEHIGLGESNSDLYTSQIQYSKDNIYDPTMIVKLPFKYNKFEVDIYNDEFPLSVFNIQKFMNMKCDIYIDKIWKFNDKYISKWKVRNIYVY